MWRENSVSLSWTLGLSRGSCSFSLSFIPHPWMGNDCTDHGGVWMNATLLLWRCFLWRAINTIIQGTLQNKSEIKEKWFMSEVYLQNTIFEERELPVVKLCSIGVQNFSFIHPIFCVKAWKGRVLDDSFAWVTALKIATIINTSKFLAGISDWPITL